MKPEHLSCLLFVFLILPGCNLLEKLSEIQDVPNLSRIQDPTLVADYRPVSMPMPEAERSVKKINSLWETGSRAFFKDQRASKVGDILTIIVALDESATIDTKSNLNRAVTSSMGVPNFFGFESKLKNVLPKAANPASLVSTSSNPALTGNAKYDRSDKMKTKVAAVVTQLLPNGNMVVQGRQEIRVYNEIRLIDLSGIVRREDISSNNTINFEKVAEGRISYGGRGDATDMHSFPGAQQVLNKISPF